MEKTPSEQEQKEAIVLIFKYIQSRINKLKPTKVDQPFREQYSSNELLDASKKYLTKFVADIEESVRKPGDEEN